MATARRSGRANGWPSKDGDALSASGATLSRGSSTFMGRFMVMSSAAPIIRQSAPVRSIVLREGHLACEDHSLANQPVLGFAP